MALHSAGYLRGSRSSRKRKVRKLSMLSSSLSHLLERARARFGLEVEVFDSTLRHVYPESATALARMIAESPGVRQ